MDSSTRPEWGSGGVHITAPASKLNEGANFPQIRNETLSNGYVSEGSSPMSYQPISGKLIDSGSSCPLYPMQKRDWNNNDARNNGTSTSGEVGDDVELSKLNSNGPIEHRDIANESKDKDTKRQPRPSGSGTSTSISVGNPNVFHSNLSSHVDHVIKHGKKTVSRLFNKAVTKTSFFADTDTYAATNTIQAGKKRKKTSTTTMTMKTTNGSSNDCFSAKKRSKLSFVSPGLDTPGGCTDPQKKKKGVTFTTDKTNSAITTHTPSSSSGWGQVRSATSITPLSVKLGKKRRLQPEEHNGKFYFQKSKKKRRIGNGSFIVSRNLPRGIALPPTSRRHHPLHKIGTFNNQDSIIVPVSPRNHSFSRIRKTEERILKDLDITLAEEKKDNVAVAVVDNKTVLGTTDTAPAPSPAPIPVPIPAPTPAPVAPSSGLTSFEFGAVDSVGVEPQQPPLGIVASAVDGVTPVEEKKEDTAAVEPPPVATSFTFGAVGGGMAPQQPSSIVGTTIEDASDGNKSVSGTTSSTAAPGAPPGTGVTFGFGANAGGTAQQQPSMFVGSGTSTGTLMPTTGFSVGKSTRRRGARSTRRRK